MFWGLHWLRRERDGRGQKGKWLVEGRREIVEGQERERGRDGEWRDIDNI